MKFTITFQSLDTPAARAMHREFLERAQKWNEARQREINRAMFGDGRNMIRDVRDLRDRMVWGDDLMAHNTD